LLFVQRARGLDASSEGDVSGVGGIVWIRTLACGAGDLGFKSPRARHFYVLWLAF
jgi:hypothetical protein